MLNTRALAHMSLKGEDLYAFGAVNLIPGAHLALFIMATMLRTK